MSLSLKQIKQQFHSIIQSDDFVRRYIVSCVNNRVQDFSDPLTSTLTLLLTTPIQIMFCESGLIILKTTLLPVFQYSLFTVVELQSLEQIVLNAPVENQQETMESSGQYTLSLYPVLNSNFTFYDKKLILRNFVSIMFKYNNDYGDKMVCKTLCNIILQRLMARTSISSEIISNVVEYIQHFSAESLLQPSSNDLLFIEHSSQNDLYTQREETHDSDIPKKKNKTKHNSYK